MRKAVVKTSLVACVAILFAGAGFAGTSAPPRNYFVKGSASFTGVSGVSAGKMHRVGPSLSNLSAGMSGIWIGENSDEPCYARAILDSLALRGTYYLSTDWDKCSGYKNTKKIDLQGRNYVHGVSVCLNGKTKGKNKHKLKGLRVYQATVDLNTGIIGKEATTPVEWKLPNCDGKWKAKRSCPSNKIARAMRIRTDETDKYITGIELECLNVEHR